MAKKKNQKQQKTIVLYDAQRKSKKQNAGSVRDTKLINTLKSLIPKGILSKAGSIIGGSMGGVPGAMMGGMAGKQLARIFGAGDYQINQSDIECNSLFGKAVGAPPAMHSNKHMTNIQHAEYVQDIICGTSGVFLLSSFDVNPGLSSLFPWLSQIAQNFETYKFRGCAFEFRSTSGEAVSSSNTALGTVILAAAYNAASSNFANKLQMENYEGAVSYKPSSSILYGLECKPSLNALGDHLYIRNSSVPSGQDQKTFDMANFQIATVGQQANSVNLGELWVIYDIELYEPKLQSLLDDANDYAHYTATAGISTSAYFGSSNSATSSSNLVLTLGAATVTFPSSVASGNWLIQYYVTQGSATGVAPAISSTTNVTGLKLLDGNSITGYVSPSATVTNLAGYYYFTVTGPAPVVTFSAGTIGTATAMDLIVTQINGTAN